MTTYENDVAVRRRAAGLTRGELAELAGVSYSAIASLERAVLPRGGLVTVDLVDRALATASGAAQRPQKGAEAVSAEPRKGDVVRVEVGGYEFLMLVRLVARTTLSDDTERVTVHGVELCQYSTQVIKDCVNAGASTHRHLGQVYVLGGSRSVLPERITRHWVNLSAAG